MIRKPYAYCIFLLVLSIIIGGCEREVDIDIPEHFSEIVVEGWIDQGKGAKVLLSLSAPFFAKIDSSNLRDYSVTRAKVTLQSDSESEVLTLKPNEVFFPPYYYFGSDLLGEIKGNYKLIIELDSEIYIAETTIPELVPIDSSWFTIKPDNDTLGLIGIQFTDDASRKDYYRVLTKRIGKDNRFIPTFTSVFSDELFNGQTININLARGNSSLLDVHNNRYYEKGDTIIIRFCSINKTHFDFWNTLQSQIISSANPFAASNTQVISNIDGGRGIWGGNAAWYDTLYTK